MTHPPVHLLTQSRTAEASVSIYGLNIIITYVALSDDGREEGGEDHGYIYNNQYRIYIYIYIL